MGLKESSRLLSFFTPSELSWIFLAQFHVLSFMQENIRIKKDLLGAWILLTQSFDAKKQQPQKPYNALPLIAEMEMFGTTFEKQKQKQP